MKSLSLFVASAAVGVQAAGWKHLMSLTCGQQLSFFADHKDMQMSMQMENGGKPGKMYDAFLDGNAKRAKQICPQLTDADAKANWDMSFGGLLKYFDKNAEHTPPPAACEDTLDSLFSTNADSLELPSSCTYARWNSQGRCDLEWDLEDPTGALKDAKIQVTVSKCDSSQLPAFGVACKGEGCSHLAKPCTSDADCGTSKCFDFAGLTWEDMQPGMDDMLNSTRWWNANADNTCDDMSLKFFNQIMNRMLPMMGFASGVPNPLKMFPSMKMCGMGGEITDGCDSLETESADPVDPMLMTYTSRTTCKRMHVSNGDISSRPLVQKAFSPVTSSKGGYPMLFSDCNGAAQLFSPKSMSWMQMTAPLGSSMLEMLKDSLQEVMACRNGIEVFDVLKDNNMFARFFAPWSHQFWFNILEWEPRFSQYLGGWSTANIFGEDANVEMTIQGWPTTCNPTTVLTTGKCSFTVNLDKAVSHLSATYNKLSIDVTIDSCSSGLPSLYVECVGSFCDLINKPVKVLAGGCSPEQQNNACGEGYMCVELPPDEPTGVRECLEWEYDYDTWEEFCKTPTPGYVEEAFVWKNWISILAKDQTVSYSAYKAGSRMSHNFCLFDPDSLGPVEDETDKNGVLREGWMDTVLKYDDPTDTLTLIGFSDLVGAKPPTVSIPAAVPQSVGDDDLSAAPRSVTVSASLFIVATTILALVF